MTIWILALLLLGGLAGIGYAQGAIRVAISFFGIILAALLAGPLAKLVKPAVAAMGVTNPVLLWIIPPFVVFIIILSIVKVVGFSVHRKIDVYYRHTAGDLKLALWERINSRLGLCLGLLNGLAYLVLIAMVFYPLSYWTVQLSSADGDPKMVRLASQIGRDLQSTGMARVARAIDPMPDIFYDAADFAGLLYQNSLLEARLSRYPAFLSMSERSEFQSIARDTAFTEARLRHAPIKDVLKNPNVQAIVQNADTLRYIWNNVSPNLKDLTLFLTDQPKYALEGKYREKILGRWYFDVKGAVAAYVRAKPNTPSSEMLKIRRFMTGAYSKTMMVAAPDNTIVLKNYPHVKPAPPAARNQPPQAPTIELQTYQGQWKGENGEYDLSLGGAGERKGKIEAGRLVVTGEGLAMVFNPED